MPSALGRLLASVTIQPHNGGSGVARKGETLRIVDVEGKQVADFTAIKLGEPRQYQHCIYTCQQLRRYKWRKGDIIYTNNFDPLWTITDDKTYNHYTGGGCCCRRDRQLLLNDDGRGCLETLQDEYVKNDIDPVLMREISVFNVFMTVDYTPGGDWLILEPVTKPGDYIDLRAEMDLMWMVSVCNFPDETNGFKPTPLRLEHYATD